MIHVKHMDFMDNSSPQNTVPRSHPHLRHDLLHRARRWRSLLRPCPWTGVGLRVRGGVEQLFLPCTKIMPPTYPRPPNLVYSKPVLSTGKCFRSRSKRGEDRRLRWRGTDPLSGDVLSKGSPAGTRTGACWTSTLRGTKVTHGMPQMAFPGAEASQAERTG